jgi:hypothetical protein
MPSDYMLEPGTDGEKWAEIAAMLLLSVEPSDRALRPAEPTVPANQWRERGRRESW